MKKPIIFLAAVVFIAACSTVPITGRKQLSLVSSEQLLPISYNAYSEFLSGHKVVRGTPEARMVRGAGTRIQRAVERYMAENNMSDRLQGYKWEFNLVEDKEANAFAMPGGKVAVYTGILPMTRDEDGLAVVMSHEIAHAVAKHHEERMSQGLAAQLGGAAVGTAVSQKPQATQELLKAAVGVGAQVGVLLPYSRLQESEADRLGLIFMAMAGYDPRAAVDFWQRMAAEKGGAAPQFLSTHPAEEKRVRDIRAALPEAMKYYSGARSVRPPSISAPPPSGGYGFPPEKRSGGYTFPPAR